MSDKIYCFHKERGKKSYTYSRNTLAVKNLDYQAQPGLSDAAVEPATPSCELFLFLYCT